MSQGNGLRLIFSVYSNLITNVYTITKFTFNSSLQYKVKNINIILYVTKIPYNCHLTT